MIFFGQKFHVNARRFSKKKRDIVDFRRKEKNWLKKPNFANVKGQIFRGGS